MEGPKNIQAEVAPMMGDKFIVKLYWDEVPGVAYYNIYRETMPMSYMPPFNMAQFGGQGNNQIVFNDVLSWFSGQALDVFYWVSYVIYDPITGLPIESDKTGPITNIHPKTLRVIEETQAIIADDLRTTGVDGSVYGQVSLYNYKIAAHQALSDINSEPTPTNFNFGTYPGNWFNLLTMGTLYYVLPKILILETAKTMQFNDQGQQWNPPDMAKLFKDLLDFYRDAFDKRKEKIKQNVRPGPIAVGSLRALYVSPQFLKFRHLDQGRPYF